MRGLNSLCDISGFCEFHPNNLFLVVEVFPFCTSHFEVDEVVEVLANFIEIDVWGIYLDFKGEDPWRKRLDSIENLQAFLFVGLTCFYDSKSEKTRGGEKKQPMLTLTIP